MTRWVIATALLAGIYMAALGSTDPLDALTGALVGLLVLVTTRPLVFDRDPPPGPSLARRLVAAPAWLAVVAVEVLRGVVQVARASVSRRHPEAAGIVAVPFGDRSATGVGMTALTATLSPGEVLLEVDWDEHIMYLHVLDASDPDEVRAGHERLYENHQRKVVP